jgi:hypothetical protein
MKKYQFTARIEAEESGGAYALFPYDVATEFGTQGKVPVQARFHGVPYRGSLIKYGHPQHRLPMLKAVREQIGLGPGDTVAVELWKDEQPRTVEVPPAFQTALEQEGVLPLFDRLSYTHRREYCRWIAEAKKEETRSTRIEKAVAMLQQGIKTPDGAKSGSSLALSSPP